jgi:glucose/arabinose dehydrogenase
VPTAKVETMITGFPPQEAHSSKTITFDDNGHIYVGVGAPSNACQKEDRSFHGPGMDPCPLLEWQGSIWQFDADKPGQTLQKNGVKYATGIRNAVALEWNHGVGELFVVQHGRDQLHELWPDMFTTVESAELPAEEFLVIHKGFVGGWPYTYWDHIQGERILAPEYGGNGKTLAEEGKYPEPLYGFPGHYAPNDLIFYRGEQFPDFYKEGAFIAFHGSWNRAPLEQRGYYVAFLPMKDGVPSGEPMDFAVGFPGQETIASPGDAVHRPMGLAVMSDGSLLMVDSVKGALWRVSAVPSKNAK